MRKIAGLLLLLMIGCHKLSFGNERAVTEAVVTAEQVSEIVDNTIAALEQEYLFPKKAQQAIQRLVSRRNAGEFERDYQFDRLQQKLEQILIAATGDSRFELLFDKPFELGTEFSSQISSGNVSVQILENNIGYIALDGDFWFATSQNEIADAIQQLLEADAMIIDIRRAHSGSVDLSCHLLGLFLPANTYLATISGPRGEVAPLYSANPEDEANSYQGPVFILQSSFVAGPWEFFSHTLQQLGRASIVGEDSMGVAIMTKSVPLAHQASLVLPYAQIHNDETGDSWLSSGVIADYYDKDKDSLQIATELAEQLNRVFTDN